MPAFTVIIEDDGNGNHVEKIMAKTATQIENATGADGKTVRSGSGAPAAELGIDGDFYIDTTAHALYGPKTTGAWGSATSIVGPQGESTASQAIALAIASLGG
jgi:hypothetical protein